MYALLENRQRRRKKRWVVATGAVIVLAVTVICIAAKASSDNKKKYADKYVKEYNNTDYKKKYADKYLKKYNNTDYKDKYIDKYLKKYNNTDYNGAKYGKDYMNKSGKPTDKKYDVKKETTSQLLEFFDTDDGADITWAHAVNNKSKLQAALDDEDIMMLEADVILNPVTRVPIMAHPPENKSDLSLEEFLDTAFSKEKKGIKLDFKEAQALEPSISILQKKIKELEKVPPIILNANILKGPNTDKNGTVDAEVFLKICGSVNKSILSPGWTTGFNGKNDTGYSTNNTDDMVSLLKQSFVTQQITFPVRASLVALNPKPMHLLLGQFQGKGSLTVWTSSEDVYDPKDLGFLRLYKKQVFFDLPASEIEIIKASKPEYDWKKYIPTSVVPSSAQEKIP